MAGTKLTILDKNTCTHYSKYNQIKTEYYYIFEKNIAHWMYAFDVLISERKFASVYLTNRALKMFTREYYLIEALIFSHWNDSINVYEIDNIPGVWKLLLEKRWFVVYNKNIRVRHEMRQQGDWCALYATSSNRATHIQYMHRIVTLHCSSEFMQCMCFKVTRARIIKFKTAFNQLYRWSLLKRLIRH